MNDKNSIISPEAIRKSIWEGIETIQKNDRTELILPWHFGISPDEKNEPLKLTVRSVRPEKNGAEVQKMRSKGWSVDDGYYPAYEISDGGRCLLELEKRLGNIEKYLPKIRRILYDCGMLELKSGRIITRTYEAYSGYRHTRELNCVLTAISLVSGIELILSVSEKSGEEAAK